MCGVCCRALPSVVVVCVRRGVAARRLVQCVFLCVGAMRRRTGHAGEEA